MQSRYRCNCKCQQWLYSGALAHCNYQQATMRAASRVFGNARGVMFRAPMLPQWASIHNISANAQTSVQPQSIAGLGQLRSIFDQHLTQAEAIVQGLFENILLFAVPKKKVTRARKRTRNANKFPKNLENVVQCPHCETQKLIHHVVEVPHDHLEDCPDCHFKNWLVFKKE